MTFFCGDLAFTIQTPQRARHCPGAEESGNWVQSDAATRQSERTARGRPPPTTCRHLSQPRHRPPWNFASGGHKAEGGASFHCLAATARSAVSFRVPHMKINPGCHAPLSLSITFMKILATRSLLFRPEFLSPTRCSPESEKQNRTIDASGPPPAEIVLGY